MEGRAGRRASTRRQVRQGAASEAQEEGGGGARDAALRSSPAGMKAASKRCLRSAAAVSTVKIW